MKPPIRIHPFLRSILFLLFIFNLLQTSRAADPKAYDVLIYGATASGIAAAVNAAREGVSVALVEETDHIGGLVSSGLSHTDFRTYESLGGTWREFMNRVVQYYTNTYGEESQQVKDCWQGGYFEPVVAKKVFTGMLEELDNIELLLNHRLTWADTRIVEGRRTKLTAARFLALESGELKELEAKVFLDATYEGDLIAMAGCAYVMGSEGPEKYGESAAVPKDWHVQCYNFRVTLSKDPANRIPLPKPPGYDPEKYWILLEGMKDGTIDEFDDIIRGPVRPIPNNKADFNDRKGSKMSIKLCNETDVWPEATPEVRQMIWQKAKNHTLGILWFLQHDERVLPSIREEIRPWGLPEDEYPEYGHWPPMIYIREGRRMVGERVFIQQDAQPEPGSVRAPAFHDAVAIGDYQLNGHGTYYECECSDPTLYGNLGAPSKPFQVPYPVILPRHVDGLLAPVPLSASRVGYGALRMEPTWTAIGQAAGIAAAMAVRGRVEPRNINVSELQEKLHLAGAITFYTADVPPGSPYFRAVQYLGNRGLFQDLYDPSGLPPAKQEGFSPFNQWQTAFPYHDIQPEKDLEAGLAEKWMAYLGVEDRPLLRKARRMTRGEFLNALYELELKSEAED